MGILDENDPNDLGIGPMHVPTGTTPDIFGTKPDMSQVPQMRSQLGDILGKQLDLNAKPEYSVDFGKLLLQGLLPAAIAGIARGKQGLAAAYEPVKALDEGAQKQANEQQKLGLNISSKKATLLDKELEDLRNENKDYEGRKFADYEQKNKLTQEHTNRMGEIGAEIAGKKEIANIETGAKSNTQNRQESIAIDNEFEKAAAKPREKASMVEKLGQTLSGYPDKPITIGMVKEPLTKLLLDTGRPTGQGMNFALPDSAQGVMTRLKNWATGESNDPITPEQYKAVATFLEEQRNTIAHEVKSTRNAVAQRGKNIAGSLADSGELQGHIQSLGSDILTSLRPFSLDVYKNAGLPAGEEKKAIMLDPTDPDYVYIDGVRTKVRKSNG